MAKTYYGYQERGAESQINWAEVGKNFSDMLSEEARVREDQKAAIDEATREYQKTLNEVPQGKSGELRTWALKFSSDAQEQMLMQERLLKNGLLKPKDYTVMRQNLLDGTDQTFTLVQKFQDLYAEKMQRLENGESQLLEFEIMQSIEGFGNFNRSQAVINPETGNVSVGFFDNDGKLSKNPNDIRSMSYLDNAVGMYFDKYKLDDVTSKFANAQGTWQEVTRTLGSSQKKGIIEIISNPMNKGITEQEAEELGISPEDREKINIYAEAENDFINGQLSNDYNTSSILTEYASAGYKYTYDQKEAGGKMIFLDVDDQGRPIPVFNDDQKADAERVLRNSIRNKISKEIQTTVVSDYTPTPQYLFDKGEEKKQQTNIAKLWADVYSGTEQERRAALAGILGTESIINSGINNIEFKDGEIKITNEESRFNRTISLESQPSFEDWMKRGTEFFGGEDIKEIISSVERGGDYQQQLETITGIGERTTQQPVDPLQESYSVLSSKISPDMFRSKNSTETTKRLRAILMSLGFEYDPSNVYGFNYIIIKNPTTGSTIEVNSNYSDDKGAAVEAKNVIDWVSGQLSKESAERFLMTARQTGGMSVH